jgi:peptidyl-prolyl cis-trans isomerase B (cyclophilin B)
MMRTTSKSKTLSRLGVFLLLTSVISFIVFYVIVMVSSRSQTYVDVSTMELVQMQEIEEGAPIAVVDTTYGEFRAVLYPQYAPATVENFITLANAGYYDNTLVFEQKQGVYAAAGAPNTDGSLDNQTVTNEYIPIEPHQNLWPLRGALCAMNTNEEGGFFDRLFGNTKTYSGSRFLLLGSVDFTDEAFVTEFREVTGSEELANAFVERGGVPNFAQQMTVFAQTYEGMEVVDAICNAAVLEAPNAAGYTPPVEECRILSVKIAEYAPEQ